MPAILAGREGPEISEVDERTATDRRRSSEILPIARKLTEICRLIAEGFMLNLSSGVDKRRPGERCVVHQFGICLGENGKDTTMLSPFYFSALNLVRRS